MIQRYRWELAVFAAWLAILAVLAVFAPAFYSRDQMRALLVNSAPVVIAATGVTLVMLAGQIDISIGSLFSLCGVLAGLAVEAGWPLFAAMILALACGALVGALNGALVAGLRLPAIVVTLGTLVALREGLRYFHEGKSISNLPPDFQWFGLSQTAGQWLVVTIAAAVAIAAAWGLANLAGGRAIYATGSDAEAARLVGIRPRRIVCGVFVASGTLAALAALVNDVRFAIVDPNAGNGLEMQAIAAVVVGGTAVTGGRGTVVGSVLGVLLLKTIGPALEFLRVEAHWERAVQGAIILAAVAFAARPSRTR